MFGSIGPVQGQHTTLHGRVTDASDGTPLPQANVRIADTIGTTTNEAGRYVLPEGPRKTATVVVSYVGYETHRQSVRLTPGDTQRVDVALSPREVDAGRITIRARDESRSVNRRHLSAAEIERLPSSFESDLFRSLSLLPGISRTSDYSSRLYIRGGGHGHTLVTLDGTPVYNPTHFLGFYSLFNADAIENVEVHKGPYPAEYGGRLGSVIDVQSRTGTKHGISGGTTLGFTASGAHVNGPLGNDADPWGTYMVAARRSTSDLLLRGLQQTDQEWLPDAASFTDLNAHVEAEPSPDDQLAVSLYGGWDDVRIENNGLRLEANHSNLGGSATWDHRFGADLTSTLSVSGSRYRNEPRVENTRQRFAETNAIGEVAVKADFQHVLNEQHTVQGGVQGMGIHFKLRNEERRSREQKVTEGWDRHTDGLSAVSYVQYTYRPTSAWRLRGGLRGTYYQNGSFRRLAPRVSARYDLTPSVQLHAAYGRTYQFRTVDADPRFSGFDTWLVADDDVPPSSSDQFSAGTTLQVGDRWQIEAAGYHRIMTDLFELTPELRFPPPEDYAERFRIGDGRAYGGELSVRRQTGAVTGRLSYTVGRTERSFPPPVPFLESAYYPASHDRTHQLAMAMQWHLTDAWTLTGQFRYKTGRPYTRRLEDPLFDEPFPNDGGDVRPPSRINDRRLPAYHRLDLGFKHTGRLARDLRYTLTTNVTNVYARSNVWFYRFKRGANGRTREDIPQIPLPVPYATFAVHF